MIKLFVHLHIDLKVYIYFDYICTSLTFTYKYLYIYRFLCSAGSNPVEIKQLYRIESQPKFNS